MEQQMPHEPKLKLKAKTLIHFEGQTYHEGEIFELRERAALDLVGQGNAEEIKDDMTGGQFRPGGGGPEGQPGGGSFPGGKHPQGTGGKQK